MAFTDIYAWKGKRKAGKEVRHGLKRDSGMLYKKMYGGRNKIEEEEEEEEELCLLSISEVVG